MAFIIQKAGEPVQWQNDVETHGLLKAQTEWALVQLKALEHFIKTGSLLIQNPQVPESLTVMNSRIIKLI